ncbi:gag-pol polyprotein [Cucumis melo var. makuwa]|uniref:Gag-pol polyprotein n=1 Tax=Cucumis melo var. makuwa TaxID=1194695 RepID=A0A5D3CNI8_CUCMM|nr:gag-pol polyprotein [Cucumis melo var. makuwa]
MGRRSWSMEAEDRRAPASPVNGDVNRLGGGELHGHTCLRAGCKIMETIREGPSASRPPRLDGKNYSYWKPSMIFFIKTLGGRAWRALVVGYHPLMSTVNGVSVSKPEVEWTDAKEQASVGNARALNSILNGVDLNVFKLINSCTIAKEA